MSIFPKRPASPPPAPPKAMPSGEHAAVKEFRRKLQSIHEGTEEQMDRLKQDLSDYLASAPPPPNTDPEPV